MWSLSLLFSLLQPSYAWEAKTNNYGKTLHWTQSEIPFYYNYQGSNLSSVEISQALQQSGQSWSFSNINLYNAGETSITNISHEDDVFSIVFQEDWNEDPEILALTYTWSNSKGEIVHFDIEVNTENFEWSTDGNAEKHDLQNTITHEFGHAIGLDHSQIEEATMAASSSIGEVNKRELHHDDKEGHQHIYGHPLEEQSPEEETVHMGSDNAKKPTAFNTGGYGTRPPVSACSTARSPFALFWIALIGLVRRFR